MNNLAIRWPLRAGSSNTAQEPAIIAAIQYGKYHVLDTTSVSCDHFNVVRDHYLATFSGRVPHAQFELIANTITKALEENTSTQVYKDCDPTLICKPKIEIKPGKDDGWHEIWVTLTTEFITGNNPGEFRTEFGRQVAEVFAKARSGKLDFDEPSVPFLQARIAKAKWARRFVK